MIKLRTTEMVYCQMKIHSICAQARRENTISQKTRERVRTTVLEVQYEYRVSRMCSITHPEPSKTKWTEIQHLLDQNRTFSSSKSEVSMNSGNFITPISHVRIDATLRAAL